MNQIFSLGLCLLLSGCRIPLTEKPVGSSSSNSPAGNTTIAVIQGDGHLSPLLGRQVNSVKGVVTLVTDEGFWMQSEESDKHSSTGLYVYDRGSSGVRTGDLIEVSGQVQEYGEANELTLTELIFPTVEIMGSTSLPLSRAPGTENDPIPLETLCNDGLQGVSRSCYDPEEDLIDYWESLEGMKVSFDSLIAGGGFKSGQIPLLPGLGGLTLPEYQDSPRPLLMMETAGQDASFESACAGDRILGPVEAILTYKWGEYTLLPLGKWTLTKSYIPQKTHSLTHGEDRLITASMNVENFSAKSSGLSDQQFSEKLNSLVDIMADSLGGPDIIALQEIMDDDGTGDRGLTEAWKNFTTLSNELSLRTGKSYYFASSDPQDKSDGGLPGANIRTGFLYDLDRVKLLEPPQRLCWEDYTDCRKPLLARFSFNGQEVMIINLHLSSRRNDTPVMGEYQPPLLKSEPNRLDQIKALREAVSHLFSENLIVLGDFNDYPGSSVLNSLLGPSLLTDAMNQLPLKDRYSYIYKGRPNQLDHILISQKLTASYEGVIFHLNSGLADEMRPSDHDPLGVSILIPEQINYSHTGGGLFFCDYGEGSGYNKYLEIANLINQNTEEEEYALLYCSGSTPLSEGKLIPLPALEKNSLTGICHSRSEAALLSKGSVINSPSFNGNDSILLIRDMNQNGIFEGEIDRVIDTIGYPLSEEDYAKDRGMKREPFIVSGSEIFRPEEWIVYSKERVDSGDNYGTHRTNQDVMTF